MTDEMRQKAVETRKARQGMDYDAAVSKLDRSTDDRKRIAARLGNMPPHLRARYLAVCAKRGAAMRAIRCFCSECMGWEGSVEAIRDCTSPECPLYLNRPR